MADGGLTLPDGFRRTLERGRKTFDGVQNTLDGSKTYTFSAATLAAAGQQVPNPTGTIKAVDIGIDIQGTADVSRISFNGVAQVLTPVTTGPGSKKACKHDGWKTFTNPSFRNQGQCVSYFEHHTKHGKSHGQKHDK